MAETTRCNDATVEGERTEVPDGWLKAARSLLARADSTSGAWIEVAQRGTTINTEQWWHAMHAWTSGRSFLRSVWRVDVEEDFEVEGTSTCAGCTGEASTGYTATDGTAFGCHQRWALRRLQRKTPVVCHDATGTLSLDMLEFAMHEVSLDVQRGTHRCVFGVVLPPSISSLSGYFPHTYPRSWMYSFSFIPAHVPGAEATLSFAALPLNFQTIQEAINAFSCTDAPIPTQHVAQKEPDSAADKCSGDGRVRAIPKEHLEKGVLKVLTMAHKWGAKHTPTLVSTQDPWEVWRVAREVGAPPRRVPFDVLVPEAMYRRCYNRLKEVYGKPWVEKWPEQTDPQKFVYEEVGIAAYLLCLWQLEREADPSKWQAASPSERPRRQTFVDAGCGNGFLTYILIMEGHDGWGVDIFSRGLWRHYPEHVQQCLEVCTMRPNSWMASSLDPDDPPVPPDAEELREEAEARERAKAAAEAPVITEQDTLALFDEMGMGCYDDEDEFDDSLEETAGETQLSATTSSPALVSGRRPPAVSTGVPDSGSLPPAMLSVSSSSGGGTDASFLQPTKGLVTEPLHPQGSSESKAAEPEPEPEPETEPGQPDKHGFIASDGRGRGCVNIGSGVAVDWILGNHADELTPWIPLIAARTSRDTRFWILPCCFWGFSAKFEYNDTRLGQYKTYLNFIEAIAQRLLFECDLEALRIPSTKNLCFVSRPRAALSCLSPTDQQNESRTVADAVEWLVQRKPNHPVHHGLLLEPSLKTRLQLATASRVIDGTSSFAQSI